MHHLLPPKPKPQPVIEDVIEDDPVEEEVRKTVFDKYFEKIPTKYSYPVYRKAAVVYQALKREEQEDEAAAFLNQNAVNYNRPSKKVVMPQVDFASEEEQRLVFELAFLTLKYQLIIEDLLEETAFFAQYPEVRDDQNMVAVMLCDFQQRKFQSRNKTKDDDDDVQMKLAEQYIMATKTKLCASLAKNRIKAKARSIDHLLPEAARLNDPFTKTVPIYAWVNLFRGSMTSAIESLRAAGYRQATQQQQLNGKVFKMDVEFGDTIIFPSSQQAHLKTMDLTLEGKLVIQDRSSLVGPHGVRSVLAEGGDVIVTNVGSGLTAVHLAALTRANDTVVHAFGAGAQLNKIQAMFENLNAVRNVKVYRERFTDIDMEDGKWRRVKCVLVLTDCSKTAIANPIDYIVNEGYDMSILKDVTSGKTDGSKMSRLAQQHLAQLKYALRFHRAQHVLYTTCSTHDIENEKVIVKSLENVPIHQRRLGIFRLARVNFADNPNDDSTGGHGDIPKTASTTADSFYRVQKTQNDSGCFLAILRREADDGITGKESTRGKGKNKGKKKTEKEKAKSSTMLRSKAEWSTFDDGSDGSGQSGSEYDDDLMNGDGVLGLNNGVMKKKKKHGVHAKKKSKFFKLSQSVAMRLTVTASDDEVVRQKALKKLAEHQKVVVHPAPFSAADGNNEEPPQQAVTIPT